MTPPNVFDIALRTLLSWRVWCRWPASKTHSEHDGMGIWVSYNDRHPKEILVGIVMHSCASPVRPSLKVCWTLGTLRWLLCKMLRKKRHVFCEFHWTKRTCEVSQCSKAEDKSETAINTLKEPTYQNHTQSIKALSLCNKTRNSLIITFSRSDMLVIQGLEFVWLRYFSFWGYWNALQHPSPFSFVDAA